MSREGKGDWLYWKSPKSYPKKARERATQPGASVEPLKRFVVASLKHHLEPIRERMTLEMP